MERFNILLPSICTCTTDYIDEIIKSIEQIINNDYSYISGSSVYLDVIKLQKYYLHETWQPVFANDTHTSKEEATTATLATISGKRYPDDISRSIRRGRKRPFLIVFGSFGNDRITAVYCRIVNEHKRSDTPFSGRLRQLLTVADTTKNGRNTITTKWSIYTP
jgi:hypothetical protein